MTALKIVPLFVAMPILSITTHAAPRTSANYTIATETFDVAGAPTSSANNRISSSTVGSITGSNATSANYLEKNGYTAGLYEIVGLSVTAPPSNNLNETATRQLVAAPLADDNTTLAALDPSTVTWSIVSGPIVSISSTGLATAGTVYQDTPAKVAGAAQNLSGQLTLSILNVTNDDFGSYAGDGIDDSWQVQYFGQNNPNAAPTADPDGDGQNNRFEFTAGLIPTDPTSRFVLSIQQVSGQPSQKNVVFTPVVSGRTYTVRFATNLTTPNWQPLTGTTQSDNGSTRSVTDTSASALKYYDVQISKP